MNNVVYYARVSTDEQGQLDAIENQINMLEDFINKNMEWKMVGEYIDRGKSATSTKGRKEYNQLYNDLDTNKFDVVVIKDLSRLNRNPLDYYKFIDRLVKNNKRLFLYTDNKFYESDDSLINGIKAILAGEYSRDISKKVNAGVRQKQKEGIPMTNGTTWGYDQKRGSKKLTINEEEAEIVRKIFNWYCEGKGFRIIYKLLETEKIRNSNGKPFAMTTLNRIIKNEKYKGILISNKKHKDFDTKQIYDNPESEWIIHKNIIPPIISEETWNKANEILRTKKRKNNVLDKEIITGYFQGTHLYSGKVFCSQCGGAYWHTTTSGKSNWQCKEYRNFGLKKEDKVHGCWNVRLYTDELNKIVKQVMYNFIHNKDAAIKNAMNVLKSSLEDNNDIKGHDKKKIEIDKLQNRKEKLIDMMADGLITKEEYINKKQSIDEQIEKLKSEINSINEMKEELKSKTDRLKNMNSILNVELEKPEDVTDKMIEKFLDKITINSEDELDVYICGIKFSVDKNNLCVTATRSN